jgi:hypothetical protein
MLSYAMLSCDVIRHRGPAKHVTFCEQWRTLYIVQALIEENTQRRGTKHSDKQQGTTRMTKLGLHQICKKDKQHDS